VEQRLAQLNALRGQYGLPPLARLLDQQRRARRQLVQTSADFDSQGTLPAGTRYVGPVLEDPAWAEMLVSTLPPAPDPLVLVAMSSTYQDQDRWPEVSRWTQGPAIDGVAGLTRPSVAGLPRQKTK
jgi:hypothetical protein